MEENNVVTVNEPAVAYGTKSYTDVMMMLYSMPITPEVKEHIGHRLVLEVREENLSKTIDRINHLAKLQDDWDGNGASRIHPKVISNIREVLLFSEGINWHDWTISPNVNGTLFLQSTEYVCSLSLGCDEYSYFCKKNGVREGESHLPFNAKAFLSTMQRLYNQLKAS